MEVGGLIVGLLLGAGIGYLVAIRFLATESSKNRLTESIYQLGSLNLDLSSVMRRMVNLLERLTESTVELILKDRNSNYLQIETSGQRKSTRQLASSDIERIDGYLTKTNQALLIASQLKTIDSTLYKILISYDIDVLIALKSQSDVIGYICLHGAPTMTVLDEIVAANNELVVVLSSAQMRDNLAEANSYLEQRVQTATAELERSNQQLQRLDQAKDEFVAMASHQLRTPLSTVKGYLSLLLEGDAGEVTAEQRKLLGEAFYASQTMVNVVNDFLSISRLQTGRFVMNKSVLDLKSLIRSEVKNLQKTAANYELELTFESEPKIPTKLRADDNKIRQAIGNLLDNAIYYSKPGGKIEVALSQQDNQLCVGVIDGGVGVPVDERDQLFDKFYRASTGKKRRPDGTGVGLYLVQEIMRAHGGRAFYHPRKQGSEFGFCLPIDKKLNPGIFIEQK